MFILHITDQYIWKFLTQQRVVPGKIYRLLKAVTFTYFPPLVEIHGTFQIYDFLGEGIRTFKSHANIIKQQFQIILISVCLNPVVPNFPHQTKLKRLSFKRY